MKKFLSVFLSLIMVASAFFCVDLTALAETNSGQCGDDLYWSLDSDTGTLTISGTGEMYDFLGADSVWYQNSAISEVVVEEGVTSIGSYAFFYCYKLKNITLPDSVISIGNNAFSGCESLTNFTITKNIKYLGNNIFNGHYIENLYYDGSAGEWITVITNSADDGQYFLPNLDADNFYINGDNEIP